MSSASRQRLSAQGRHTAHRTARLRPGAKARRPPQGGPAAALPAGSG